MTEVTYIQRTTPSITQRPDLNRCRTDQMRSFESTLLSSKGGIGKTVSEILLFIPRMVLKVILSLGNGLSWLLSCFCSFSSKKETIDWEICKEKFSVMYAAAITSTSFDTTRQKEFDKGYSTLTDVERERFHQHIGFQLALKEWPPIRERVGQEQFYKEKCTLERVREQLFVNNKVLTAAVKEFQKELERKA